MLKEGDSVLITIMTRPGLKFVGTIGVVDKVDVDDENGTYPYLITCGHERWWGNGVLATDLIKALA